MPASWGQRSRARAARRWRSEVLVDAGGLATWPSCPYPPGSTMERMPASPYVICLGDAERAELESLSRRAAASFRLVLRSRIVLLAAAGTANRVIAEQLASARTRPASGGAGTAGRA